MAKINIDFNNKTYEIDESALAKAAASLSSHLSTVMNGSGATINLNGVTYSVDSSKLTTATNAFVSYLGTVSGNGSKVVVNGVEYTVDATKMTKATADLQTVLGDLVSGGGNGGSDDAVIFPEQTLTGFVENNLSFFSVSLEPAPFTLTDGMAYRVAWDGEVYDVTAVYSSDWEITYIGDGSLLGLPGNGEPFVIVDQGDLIEVHSTTDASQSHTVAIYKVASDNGGSDTPTTDNFVTWRTTDVDGREIVYDGSTPAFMKISDVTLTAAELEGAIFSVVNNSTNSTQVSTLSVTDGSIADYGSVVVLGGGMALVSQDDGAIIEGIQIPTKGIWVSYQLTLADMTLTLTWGNNSDTPETGAHGLYFGKKYNGYTGDNDSVSILMSMMFGADGSNTVYSGDGNVISNNPAGSVTYEGNAICLNGEPWYLVSEDGVILIAPNTNGVAYVLDPSAGVTSAVIPDGVTEIGGASFAYYDILTSITIPASVTSIGGYAFYECTGLTTITFEGTKAQWNAITFGGADWNYNVPTTTVQCSDGTVSL